MPCLRSLGKALKVYDLHGRTHAAWPSLFQAAVFAQPRAGVTDFVCEPATGAPAHPFQPVASSSTTGDTFVPKGAKLSGHGAHPLARYRCFVETKCVHSCYLLLQPFVSYKFGPSSSPCPSPRPVTKTCLCTWLLSVILAFHHACYCV